MTLATPDGATWLTDRALVRVSGAEASAFLQGLLTQNVEGLTPGTPRYAGLLSPQGKALFDMMLWADPLAPGDVLIDCEAARRAALVKRLSLYRLRRPVTITPEDLLGIHWSPGADAAPDGAVPDPRLAVLGRRWLGPAGSGDGAAAYRAHRLNLGIMEGGDELGEDKTLWLECNARELNGVDFTKGCYVGQENTARMHYRAKVNRRLVVLPIALSDPARQRAIFPDLGLAIDHRQVETLKDLPLAPWLAAAIAEPAA